MLEIDPESFKKSIITISLYDAETHKPVEGIKAKPLKLKHSWTEEQLTNKINGILAKARISLTGKSGTGAIRIYDKKIILVNHKAKTKNNQIIKNINFQNLLKECSGKFHKRLKMLLQELCKMQRMKPAGIQMNYQVKLKRYQENLRQN